MNGTVIRIICIALAVVFTLALIKRRRNHRAD